MSNREISIWGRSFNLSISYDIYPGEAILETQKTTLEQFLCAAEEIEQAKESVVQYVLKNNCDDIGCDHIDNIFKYVIPRAVFVSRKPGVIYLLCNYRFDIEHGIAIVFEDGKAISVGIEDNLM